MQEATVVVGVEIEDVSPLYQTNSSMTPPSISKWPTKQGKKAIRSFIKISYGEIPQDLFPEVFSRAMITQYASKNFGWGMGRFLLTSTTLN